MRYKLIHLSLLPIVIICIKKIINDYSYIKNNEDHLNWHPSKWCITIEESKISSEAVALYICTGGDLWRILLTLHQ